MTETPALRQVIAYLKSRPMETARVPAKEMKAVFRGRSKPLHECVQDWADANGFTLTGDRPSLAIANVFIFRRRKECDESPDGQHDFKPDLEYDSTGETINCMHCGETKP